MTRKDASGAAHHQGNGLLPKRVQKSAPSTGSGREAKRALNLPIMPKASMKAAPYCITRRLPTCRTEAEAGDQFNGNAPAPWDTYGNTLIHNLNYFKK